LLVNLGEIAKAVLEATLGRLVGHPKDHATEKADPNKATIQAPEFDITQYAKKLGVAIGVLIPGLLGVLKAAKVEISTPVMVGALGVTAAAMIGISLAVAADILGRVYADRSVKWSGAASNGGGGVPSSSMTVWLSGETEACPVVTIDRSNGQTSYLVLKGSTSKKTVDGKDVEVYDGKPTWVEESEVTACSMLEPSAPPPKAVADGGDGA
jgi:hypothetical protein